MSACVNLLGGILTLTCYGVVFIAVHEKFIPSSRNGDTRGEIIVGYTNPHGMGEGCTVGSPRCL